MREEGLDLPLPPNPAPFLVDYLNDIGPTISTGMGSVSLEWRDIAAWEASVGFSLPPWQARLIRSLSHDYLAMSREAEKPACPAPWTPEVRSTDHREVVSDKVGQLFRGLAKANGGALPR